MSFIMKPKNRTKLYAIIAIAVIGGGLFMFYGEDMIGFASGLFIFENEDGIAGQCAVDASLGAYDANGDLIETKMLQSGFYISGVEVSKIVFSIMLTLSGSNIDWDTVDFEQSKLMIYPNGGTSVNIGDDLLTKDEFGLIDNDQQSGIIEFTIWDEFYAPQQAENNPIFLLEALGDPVEILTDGTEIFLLQMVFEIRATAIDVKDNTIEAGADVIGTWELNTLSDGQLNIVVDGGGDEEIDYKDLDPEITKDLDIEDKIQIEKDIVDNDVQPDVTVISKDSVVIR